MKGIIHNGYIEVKKYHEPAIYDPEDYGTVMYWNDWNELETANIASPDEDVWRIEIANQPFEKHEELTEIIRWFACHVPVPGSKWGKLLRCINNALMPNGTEVEFIPVYNKGVII